MATVCSFGSKPSTYWDNQQLNRVKDCNSHCLHRQGEHPTLLSSPVPTEPPPEGLSSPWQELSCSQPCSLVSRSPLQALPTTERHKWPEQMCRGTKRCLPSPEPPARPNPIASLQLQPLLPAIPPAIPTAIPTAAFTSSCTDAVFQTTKHPSLVHVPGRLKLGCPCHNSLKLFENPLLPVRHPSVLSSSPGSRDQPPFSHLYPGSRHTASPGIARLCPAGAGGRAGGCQRDVVSRREAGAPPSPRSARLLRSHGGRGAP